MLTTLLVPLVAEYLMASRENRALTTISPSMVGHCSRQIVMSILQYPSRPKTPKDLRVFDVGDSMHEDYQEYFQKMGILVARELPLNSESKNPWVSSECARLRIRGRLDAIVRIDRRLYVVELKSAKESSFKRMLENGPYEEYVDQLTLYMYLTRITNGIILVENKNDQDPHEFKIPYDEKRALEIVEKIVRINKFVFDLKLPPREHRKEDIQCKYLCDFKDICWSRDAERHLRENRGYLLELLGGRLCS